MKTVGVGGNCATFFVAILFFLQFLAQTSVGGTFFLLEQFLAPRLMELHWRLLLVLQFLAPKLLEPLSRLLLDLQFMSLNREKLLVLERIMPHLL